MSSHASWPTADQRAIGHVNCLSAFGNHPVDAMLDCCLPFSYFEPLPALDELMLDLARDLTSQDIEVDQMRCRELHLQSYKRWPHTGTNWSSHQCSCPVLETGQTPKRGATEVRGVYCTMPTPCF